MGAMSDGDGNCGVSELAAIRVGAIPLIGELAGDHFEGLFEFLVEDAIGCGYQGSEVTVRILTEDCIVPDFLTGVGV